MGDARFTPLYERVRDAPDRMAALASLSDEDVIAALAATSRSRDPWLANVLASHAQNRVRRKDSILRTMAEGVYSLDLDGRVTYMNPAAERILGWTQSEILGERMHPLIHYEDARREPRDWESCAFQGALAGESISDADDVFILRSGEILPVAWAATPIRTDGDVEGVVVVFRDIRDAKEAEAQRIARARLEQEDAARRERLALAEAHLRRLTALAEASRTLAEATLDPVNALQAIADAIVRVSGDVSVLRVLSDDGTLLVPVAISHRDAARADALRGSFFAEPVRADAGVHGRVVATRDVVQMDVEAPEFEEAGPAEHVAALRKLGVRCVSVAPLRLKDRVIGTLGLSRETTSPPFTREDSILIADLAERAALAIENLRLQEAERSARTKAERWAASVDRLARAFLEGGDVSAREIEAEAQDAREALGRTDG